MANKLRCYRLDDKRYFVGQNACQKSKRGTLMIIMNSACVIEEKSFSRNKTPQENIKELYLKTEKGLRQFPSTKIAKNYTEIDLD